MSVLIVSLHKNQPQQVIATVIRMGYYVTFNGRISYLQRQSIHLSASTVNTANVRGTRNFGRQIFAGPLCGFFCVSVDANCAVPILFEFLEVLSISYDIVHKTRAYPTASK